MTGPWQSEQRNVKRIKTNQPGTTFTAMDYGTKAKYELDTRADTCCAGVNCPPLYFTGQQCDVQGFHQGLTPIQNIPVDTVATAWADPTTGRGYILIRNEVLYFGHEVDHTLINPNQLRHYGNKVHNNPYDLEPSRSMDITIPDKGILLF